MEQRVTFWQLFQQLPDGRLVPRRIINVNGAVIGPGVALGPGAYVGGIDFFKILGRDISVQIQNNIYVIKGYFGTPVTF